MSLDASLNGHQNFELNIEPWNIEDIIIQHEIVDEHSNTELFCQSMILSFLRLLINSREELSLAKVIGPDALLDHKIFTIIR